MDSLKTITDLLKLVKELTSNVPNVLTCLILKKNMEVVKTGEIVEETMDMVVVMVDMVVAEEAAEEVVEATSVEDHMEEIEEAAAGEEIEVEVDIKEVAEVVATKTEIVVVDMVEAEAHIVVVVDMVVVEKITLTENHKTMEVAGVEEQKPQADLHQKVSRLDSVQEVEEEQETTSNQKIHHLLDKMPRSFKNQRIKTQQDALSTLATCFSMLMSKI
jgi:hypothetical protein